MAESHSQEDPQTTFSSSSVTGLSHVDGVAVRSSIDDDATIHAVANTERHQGDHSHSFFAAPQNERFWVASVIVAVLLHKLFLHGKKKEFACGNVPRSAPATADVASAPDQGKSSHVKRDSNNKEGNKSTESSRGNISKKLIHKDAASLRNYDKVVNTTRMKENENLTRVSKKKDETTVDKTTDTPSDLDHAILSFSANSVIENNDLSNQVTLQHTKAHHPGLKGYRHWQTTITSLYRIYAIPRYSYPNNNNQEESSNTSFLEAILPMQPSSERGQIPIDLEVTNRTNHEIIHVFWLDYNGKEVYKGSMRQGETWNQTTYIGHPWIFRVGDDGRDCGGSMGCGFGVWNDGDKESVLLKYVPFRAIPSIPGAETVNAQNNVHFRGPAVGVQRFTLRDVPEGYGEIINGRRWKPVCVVEDGILPECPLVLIRNGARVIDPFAPECYDEWGDFNSNDPSQIDAYNTAMSEIYTAIKWSCQQIQREEVSSPGCGIAAIKRLRQYLSSISAHPHEPKYRKLRIANPTFLRNVYNSGARGVLLALGFEEHCGYLECGAAEGQMLTQDRIKMVSDAMAMLFTTLNRMERESESQRNGGVQPLGIDGFGRAGFGYAGSMNRFL